VLLFLFVFFLGNNVSRIVFCVWKYEIFFYVFGCKYHRLFVFGKGKGKEKLTWKGMCVNGIKQKKKGNHFPLI
jgi:hypothetical protein